MTTDFTRFKATDGVELQGWLNNADGDIAVIHVHGMSGNGYENYFLDNLVNAYTDMGVSLFTFDNRGRGIISWFRSGGDTDAWGDGEKKGGSCFEIFEESVHDIQGAIDFAKSKGKTKFILQGHSLGCTKVVNYLLTSSSDNIIGVVLLAPTDMSGWANTDPLHKQYLAKAHDLITQGKPTELVSSACWLDHTPLSAQTYPSICEDGTPVDIYGTREGGALLGKVQQPMVIIYGDKDIGITEIDGDINAWKQRVEPLVNSATRIETIAGASHSYAGYENTLAKIAARYISQFKG